MNAGSPGRAEGGEQELDTSHCIGSQNVQESSYQTCFNGKEKSLFRCSHCSRPAKRVWWFSSWKSTLFSGFNVVYKEPLPDDSLLLLLTLDAWISTDVHYLAVQAIYSGSRQRPFGDLFGKMLQLATCEVFGTVWCFFEYWGTCNTMNVPSHWQLWYKAQVYNLVYSTFNSRNLDLDATLFYCWLVANTGQ